MKKNYIAPLIKVRKIESDPMMAASDITLSVSGGKPIKNTDGSISINSKKGIFDSDEGNSSSSSIWDNE